MKYFDLTLPAPSANLACDEALLDACEENPAAETLRFWESPRYFVVLGYANRAAREANLEGCRRENAGVYRRCSGGGAVAQGPGCLNYVLALRIGGEAAGHTIAEANRLIMERQRRALGGLLGREVSVQGITDLALEGMKFSGNAQKRRRRALLFHGTFLLDFDLAVMDRLLPAPSRQPDYRGNRPHGQFLINLRVDASRVKAALREAWGALELLEILPEIPPALARKYASEEWNYKF